MLSAEGERSAMLCSCLLKRTALLQGLEGVPGAIKASKSLSGEREMAAVWSAGRGQASDIAAVEVFWRCSW